MKTGMGCRMCIIAAMLGMGASYQANAKDPFVEPGPQDQSQDLPPEPDHLVPLDPDPEDWYVRYTRLLAEKLKSGGFCFARMERRPSFGGESSLRLHGRPKDRDIGTTKEFFLTHSVAARSIWSSMNHDKMQKQVKVTTTTAPISKDLAVRVCSIWERMIQRVRKPEAENMGLDGETIEFSTPKGTGETWTPMQRKSPLMLVELGQSLAEYCQAVPEKRASELKKVEKKAADLEKYLKDHKP